MNGSANLVDLRTIFINIIIIWGSQIINLRNVGGVIEQRVVFIHVNFRMLQRNNGKSISKHLIFLQLLQNFIHLKHCQIQIVHVEVSNRDEIDVNCLGFHHLQVYAPLTCRYLHKYFDISMEIENLHVLPVFILRRCWAVISYFHFPNIQDNISWVSNTQIFVASNTFTLQKLARIHFQI